MASPELLKKRRNYTRNVLQTRLTAIMRCNLWRVTMSTRAIIYLNKLTGGKSVKESRGIQALRNAGYKLTSPRLTILDILEQSGGHVTSAELLLRVEQRDASIGRASVFRTLELMIKLGIVWTSVQGGSTVHYMLMPGGHHHHIVCTNCDKLIEFEDCRLDTLISSLEHAYGVQVEGHLLELYGICQDCQNAKQDGKHNHPDGDTQPG